MATWVRGLCVPGRAAALGDVARRTMAAASAASAPPSCELAEKQQKYAREGPGTRDGAKAQKEDGKGLKGQGGSHELGVGPFAIDGGGDTHSKRAAMISFDDATSAFAFRTTMELVRAWLVLTGCKAHSAIENSNPGRVQTMLKMSEKLFSKRMTHFCVKKTFFDHFCAGQDAREIAPVIARLR